MSVAFPPDVACAIVVTGAEVVTCSVEVVAIIFLICADVDRVLAVLTIMSLTQASALVDGFAAVAAPLTEGLMACTVVHTRVTNALVDVDVAVATESRIVGVVITLHYVAFRLVLKHKRYCLQVETLRAVFTSTDGVATVFTHTVREAIHACALICIQRDLRLYNGVRTCGAVVARAAITLVHVNVTVPSQTWGVRLQVRCDEAIVVGAVALEHSALEIELSNATDLYAS